MCGLSLATASLSVSAAVWEPWAAVPGHSCCVEWLRPAGLQVWSSPGGLVSLAFKQSLVGGILPQGENSAIV